MQLITLFLVIWSVVLATIALLVTRTPVTWFTSPAVESAFGSLASRFDALSRRPYICAAIIFGFVIVARLSTLSLLPIPLPGVHDEFSYLLGGDTFASGRWTNPTPKLWEFFEVEHVLVKPTYSAKYPPGQACVLAVGQLLGNPWYGVLISFAVMCTAIYWMLRAYLPPKWALLAGLFPLVQPGISSYWCNSYWGGCLAATGSALVFGACGRLSTKLSTSSACMLAIGLVLLANSRPFEGLAAIFFPMLFLAFRLFKRRKVKALVRYILLPLLILLVCFSGTLYFQYRVTGSPFLAPHVLYHTQYERTPLWKEKPLYPEPVYHNQQVKDFWTLEDVDRWHKVQTLKGYLEALNDEVILGYFSIFVGPWLAPLAVAALLSLRDRRSRVFWCASVTMGTAVMVALFLHYFERHYLAPITGPTYYLLGQGFRHLRLLKLDKKPVGLVWSRLVLLSALVGLIAGFLSMPTLRKNTTLAQQTFSTPRAQISEQLSALPGKHLVIIHYAAHHDPGYEWVFNRADLDNAKIIWARDFGERNKELFDYYKDRKVWVVDADSRPPRLYTLDESKSAALSTKYPDPLPF